MIGNIFVKVAKRFDNTYYALVTKVPAYTIVKLVIYQRQSDIVSAV